MRLVALAALAVALAASAARAAGAAPTPSAPPAQGSTPSTQAPPDGQPAPGEATTPPGGGAAPEKTPQTPPRAAQKPPAAASDLARALLTSEQWEKILDSYASSLSSQVSQSLLASGEKVPDDLRDRIRAELGKSMPYQATVDAQAEALSRQLTPDELKKTAAFYKSDLGKKVLDRLPEAQSVVARQLQTKLASAVPEIVNKVAPKAMQGSPHGGGPPAQGRRPPATQGGTGTTTQ
jgi:hypothetical protein